MPYADGLDRLHIGYAAVPGPAPESLRSMGLDPPRTSAAGRHASCRVGPPTHLSPRPRGL